MTESSIHGDIATDLLLDLERRLRRVEFYISGAHEPQDVPSTLKPPVYRRLETLEQKLRELTSSHPAYRDLLNLCQFLQTIPPLYRPTDTIFWFRLETWRLVRCPEYTSHSSFPGRKHDTTDRTVECSQCLRAVVSIDCISS